jgi:hypothetical protein
LHRGGDSLQCHISVRREERPGTIMWMLLLEAGVALALLLFIVWWTWPRRDDKDDTRDKS